MNVSENFFSKWNENVTNLAFLQLHLLEDECKKKLVSLNKTKADLRGQLKGLCDCNTFKRLMNFTAKIVSNLQSKLHAKNLKKTRRDSNDSTMHYPTDFPIYVQIVDALVDAVDSQPERGLNIERNKFEHARTNQSHAIPSENQQVPQTTSIGNNSTSNTRAQKRRKTRRSRKSTSYAKRKAPIRLDTSTVINLSNVDLTEDEVLLLSRGLTFCPTPRHIDWAQIKADINDFSRRLRIKEFFYDNNNCDLEPNPFRLKSTWCPPANREPVLDVYIDSVERDIMTAKPTRIRDNLTRRERQSLKKLRQRTDIVIKPADKGSGTVVMNRQNYLD